MSGVNTLLIVAAVLLVTVFILVCPLQLAAKAMGARRYGVGWCLLALISASIMQMVGLSVPVSLRCRSATQLTSVTYPRSYGTLRTTT